MKKNVKPVYANIDDTLYVKRGNKFIPCSDPWAITGLRNGHWHVWVRDGSTTMRERAWPDRSGLEAAIWEAKEAMLEKIREASKYKAETAKQTPLERKAYRAYCDVLNSKTSSYKYDHVLRMWGCSAQDLVDAALSAVDPDFVPKHP